MIYCVNEWGKLTKTVVGDASWANWPSNDPVFSQEHLKTTWTETPVPRGPVPQSIIDEANEDLADLASTLAAHGVEVLRPTQKNFQLSDGLYNYCPRDRFLIYQDTVVDTAMMYPCRDQELECYSHIISEANTVLTMPRNQGMVCDAANILKFDNHWLFLLSASGNHQAYQWLCDAFPEVNIELCNFYSGVHLDSTIVPLRQGLVMLNASRVTFDTVPKVFDGWHKIWVNSVVPQDFYQYPYASKWIAMNMLVLDHDHVIVDQAQTALIKQLESYRFTVIPQRLRHARTLGGGFHCVTLDLVRQ